MYDAASARLAVSADAATWYKDAIIYELHVRAFYDKNGDGIGDFPGLIEKIDYLSDLGVTAVWLLPFYPSPGKDDGYDIARYDAIHPAYGTLADFKEFLRAAHARGIRVITELVLNHTSDQHEWFQKSRRAPPGDPWRDFYVWSDSPDRYRDTRIIFKDFEHSNWSWDPIAQRYYWHRFYSHQPDLNFDNPLVRRKMLATVDFWLGMGVDGLRLDAVPYLFEREHTSCENLPETHAFLKELRAHVDRRFPGRMLLAEANQWPEDAVDYFGDGDECHMAFHFPLMPRLFMSVRREDRFPILDILEQTPPIPKTCQWATFLRNHDELTLEMVTDEERDYMYKVFAADPQARINLGIRHRLAPLLGNDRRQIELLKGLLFSLPGTPVLYYGDEIGMGDNIFLGDRNGVRTPFQWSADRNAGFSRANPQQLYLPVIINPEYHYETVNVETQQSNPNSLLWWTKNLIRARKMFPSLARGDIEFLHPENTKVLAFLRRLEGETVLVVANLSRKAQFVELDLRKFAGMTPVEVFGRTDFPTIGELPYLITLGPYAFYWFNLVEGGKLDQARPHLMAAPHVVPIQIGRKPLEALKSKQVHARLAADLPDYLQRMRWFTGKSRRIEACEIIDAIPLEVSKDRYNYALATVVVHYDEGEPERFLLTLGFAEGEQAERLMTDSPHAVISREIARGGSEPRGLFFDATVDASFFQELLHFVLHRRVARGNESCLKVEAFRPIRKAWLREPPKPRYRGFEQSNTSILYERQFFLKLYRRLEPGTNPEIEIGRFLTNEGRFRHAPRILAALTLEEGRRQYSIGVLESYVENEGDAWSYTLDFLKRFGEEVLAMGDGPPPVKPLPGLFERLDMPPPEGLRDLLTPYLEDARLMGRRVAELHAALGREDLAGGFKREEFTPFYQRSYYQSLRNSTEATMKALRNALDRLEENARLLGRHALERGEDIYKKIAPLKTHPLVASRIRCHGDLHLGQILHTGKDFIIMDFEGEPATSIGERKIKRTPLKDVAGMLRSFDYAIHLVEAQGHFREEDLPRLRPRLAVFAAWAKSEFFASYLQRIEEENLIPSPKTAARELRILLEACLVEKTLYEIRYELAGRPHWVAIPLKGLIEILEGSY